MRRTMVMAGCVGLVVLVGIAGCSEPTTRTKKTTVTTVQTADVDVTRADLSRAQEVEGGGQWQRFELAYPTGSRETSALLVEKVVPRSVRAGQPYTYSIRVTNLTDAPLANVVIDDRARGIEIGEASMQTSGAPEARAVRIASEEPGRWTIGTLPPRATRTLRVTATAAEEGRRASCLSVDYEPTLCGAVDVVQPELQLTKTAPEASYVCEPLSFRYEVANTGSGVARDVMIVEQLPDGLTTRAGTNTIRIEVGDLSAGARETFSVPVQARRTGTFQSRATARSVTGEVVSSATRSEVVQPELAVDVTGPEWQYIGEPVTYTIRVTNVSEVTAPDTSVVFDTPGTEAPAPRKLGTLRPGETRSANVTMRATGEQLQLGASARGACAPPASDRVATDVRSVEALLVETVDTSDPVNVGETTSYEVRVKNQGPGVANDVEVSAVIPPEITVIDVDGPTRARMVGDRLQLGTIEALPPGETARWTVQVRGDQPGSARFRTEVDSPILERPVPDVEPTQVIQPR